MRTRGFDDNKCLLDFWFAIVDELYFVKPIIRPKQIEIIMKYFYVESACFLLSYLQYKQFTGVAQATKSRWKLTIPCCKAA